MCFYYDDIKMMKRVHEELVLLSIKIPQQSSLKWRKDFRGIHNEKNETSLVDVNSKPGQGGVKGRVWKRGEETFGSSRSCTPHVRDPKTNRSILRDPSSRRFPL